MPLLPSRSQQFRLLSSSLLCVRFHFLSFIHVFFSLPIDSRAIVSQKQPYYHSTKNKNNNNNGNDNSYSSYIRFGCHRCHLHTCQNKPNMNETKKNVFWVERSERKYDIFLSRMRWNIFWSSETIQKILNNFFFISKCLLCSFWMFVWQSMKMAT